MPRPFVCFLIVAVAVLTIDSALILIYGTAGDSAAMLWWLINFPSIPFVWFLVGPPPMGEAEVSPWDYTAIVVSAVSASIIWGVVGASFAWLTGPPRYKPYDS